MHIGLLGSRTSDWQTFLACCYRGENSSSQKPAWKQMGHIGWALLPIVVSIQEKLLTVTLVTVTQCRAIWLQWHFSDFPISNLIVKFSCLQWHSISHSLRVTLFCRSRGCHCHCNRLLLYLIFRQNTDTCAEFQGLPAAIKSDGHWIFNFASVIILKSCFQYLE